MIASFQLKFGRVIGSAGDPITATPVIVFVGPTTPEKAAYSPRLRGIAAAVRRTKATSSWKSSPFLDWTICMLRLPSNGFGNRQSQGRSLVRTTYGSEVDTGDDKRCLSPT